MIHFNHVVKKYGHTTILDDLSLDIEEGEFAVLIGPSGCGKTTTLKSINRLIQPDSGSIHVNGKDISTVDPVNLRRQIGYVIQQIGLFPNMTVAQNIAVVPKRLGTPKKDIDNRVRELLAMVDMSYEDYAHKYPSELSGGQQQRIGVLRALAAAPPIVLMDEPFGALDPMTRSSLQEEIIRLHRKLHTTFVFVTHDMDEALKLADKIIFMENGRIVQMDSPENMLENPANDTIRSFMGKRTSSPDGPELTAADVMKKSPVSVYRNRGIKECTDLMARRGIDSLIVKNDDDTYAGVISIATIRSLGRKTGTIADIPFDGNETATVIESAQTTFDKLVASHNNYVVVLTEDNQVAGIVTRTSMAKAMADVLWGDTP